jgi:hypothetical protein
VVRPSLVVPYKEAFFHLEIEDLVGADNDVAYWEENLNVTLVNKHFACLNQNDEVDFYNDNVMVIHDSFRIKRKLDNSLFDWKGIS